MSRVWFSQPLEATASYWRVLRRDGVTLGYTTHDRDLWFDGIVHSATPGMVPSAIRRSADLQADSADVQGALSHDSIAALDLALGRFDAATVEIGVVDWETLERSPVYRGTIGDVTEEAGQFTATLQSRKLELDRDPVPRTSPVCRAQFCGPGCTLSGARFTHDGALTGADQGANTITTDVAVDPALLVGGSLRWLDGPLAGLTMGIAASSASALELDRPLDLVPPVGTRVRLREGCDRTIGTCATRFGNAINFQGEPYLPGNDLLSRYVIPPQ